MQAKNWLVYDGELKPADQPVLSAGSRGLMYGDGCFDTFRAYSGQFLDLEKHLDRLEEGARFLGMDYPELLETTSFRHLLHKLLAKNDLQSRDAVIRVQVWRKGGRGYNVEPGSPAHFTIMAGEYNGSAAPVKLAVADIKRIPDQSLPSRFKLSNGINYIIAASRARAKGADDALMLTLDDQISETTIANIFWLKNDVICTPSDACDLLPGITRAALIDVLKNVLKRKVDEGIYTLNEILQAEAVWICNSVRELVPVTRIGDQSYPAQHPVFERVREAFITYRDQKLCGLT